MTTPELERSAAWRAELIRQATGRRAEGAAVASGPLRP